MFGLVIRSFFLTDQIMQKTILIAFAGLVGTLLRYWLSGYVARQYGETFPWGTMAVNLIGCFVTGAVFYATEERFLINPTVRTVILIGLLGGFTTFSSYGLQTFTLLRDGEYGLATLNVVTSNVLGLFMVWAGYAFGKVF
jgi:fluoride exporter